MTKLYGEDWKKLDDLLGKVGFGGYFDMVETLKTIASNLAKKLLETEEDKDKWYATIKEEKDILTLVLLIAYLANLVNVDKPSSSKCSIRGCTNKIVVTRSEGQKVLFSFCNEHLAQIMEFIKNAN